MKQAFRKLGTKKTLFLLLSVVMALALVLLIPLDFFYHGFYCEPIAYGNISEEDLLSTVDVSQEAYTTTFSPQEKRFAGFEVFIADLPEDTAGELVFTTYNQKGEMLESLKAEISTMYENTWYIITTGEEYQVGQVYQLQISARNCTEAPRLQLVDNGYLQEESLDGQLLIWYGYAQPTFTIAEKCILLVLSLAVWSMLLGELWFGEASKQRKATRAVALVLSITAVLNWNYMFNSFDEENSGRFPEFQDVSDTLVMSMIQAERSGVELGYSYGLGNLYTPEGMYYLTWNLDYPNDDTWTYGYSKTEPKITIAHNQGTEMVARVGTILQFANGDQYEILQVEDTGETYIFTLNSDTPLNYFKYGSLNDVTYYSAEGEPYTVGSLSPYISQYGLQGKVFRHIARYIDAEDVEECLWLLCTFSLALVLALITVLVGRKYNVLLGLCFGFTFLLSPWIVNFSNSVYWVEVTWFLPMLVGLLCALWIHRRAARIAAYVAAFVCILGKSLCGYEYITTIMLGLIAFLLADWILALVRRDKQQSWLLFRTIFMLGLAALAGFAAAIFIHATLRGDGNILAGVKSIIERDVLRRVGGGNLNYFEPKIWPSLNASVWETLKMYFHFSTDVIAGVDGNVFPLLCFLPLVIFLYDYVKKQLDVETVVLYVVFFVTSISWLVLGKSHSYIHTHMNFVLWYFGFVQVCFYTIARKILQVARGRKGEL